MTQSIYVHIPFCSSRCDYCDFATWVDKNDLIPAYVEAISAQWNFHLNSQDASTSEPIHSIFFGGGTPNYIDADYIVGIITGIKDHVELDETTEITIESNPDHVTMEKLEKYKNCGVNRISLGVQSTQDKVLKYLGREHNPDHVFASINKIKQVDIENISVDLIYGSPVESIQDWQQTLYDAMSFGAKHISAYALGIEKGTPLSRSIQINERQNTDEDDLANKYEITDEFLSNNGYSWYEISNWSKPGFESRHNLTYWRGGQVVALGCAAHGFTKSRRWSTPRNIDTYLKKFSTSTDISDDSFIFADRTSSISRAEEKFALELRTKMGIYWPFDQSKQLEDLVRQGFVEFYPESHTLYLSRKGRLMAHTLTIMLFDEYKRLMETIE